MIPVQAESLHLQSRLLYFKSIALVYGCKIIKSHCPNTFGANYRFHCLFSSELFSIIWKLKRLPESESEVVNSVQFIYIHVVPVHNKSHLRTCQELTGSGHN